MSLETRLRQTGQMGGAGGGSSAGLAGTANFLVTWSADPLVSNEKVLTGGNSTAVRTDGTAIYIDATTSSAYGSAGWVQFNSANTFFGNSGLLWDNTGFTLSVTGGTGGLFTAYQMSGGSLRLSTALAVDYGGTNVTSFGTGLLYSSSGGTGSILALSPRTANSILGINSNNYTQEYKTLVAGSSIVINYGNTGITINATTSAGGSSGGLAGTGMFYIMSTAQTTFPNARQLQAGSSVIVRTDATNIYVDALTSGGMNFMPLLPQQAKLYSNNSAARIEAGTAWWRLLFSRTTQQYGVWQFLCPPDYGSNPYVRLAWAMGSTVAAVLSTTWTVEQFSIPHDLNNNPVSFLYLDTFGGANSVTVGLSAGYSSGTVQILTIPLATIVSLGANRLTHIRLSCTGNFVSDNIIAGLNFEYTRTL